MSCEKLIIPSTHNKSEFSKSEILQTWKDPPKFDGNGGSVGNFGGTNEVMINTNREAAVKAFS